jgi:uncharacterized protein (TIGR03000 family)
MSSNLNRGRFHLVWIGVLLAAGPAGSQEAARRAQLHIRLPANARLTIEGQKTMQTGPLRHFYSPPLESGKSYHYTFVWTYQQEGQTYQAKKTLHVRAGEDRQEDLTKEKGEEVGEAEAKPANKTDAKPDAVFVPTPPEVVNKMLELAKIEDTDVVYDLGCGNGRIVIAAAQKYKCKAVGFDIDVRLLREANENAEAAGVEKHVTFEKKDLFKVDLKPASVVTLYLRSRENVRLLPQLEKLKDGSRIVSHDFQIEGYSPKETATIPVEGDRDHKVYLYETPLKKK